MSPVAVGAAGATGAVAANEAQAVGPEIPSATQVATEEASALGPNLQAALGSEFGAATQGAAEELQALAPQAAQSLPTVETEASPLLEACDQAAATARRIVEQEMRDGRFSSATSPGDLNNQVQRRFGMWLDALAKTNIRQAVAEGRLPNTFVTSPTMGISRGYVNIPRQSRGL